MVRGLSGRSVNLVSLPHNPFSEPGLFREIDYSTRNRKHPTRNDRRQRLSYDDPVGYDQEAALRIFAIGGSTTEQLVIDDRSTFTHLLQQNLASKLGIDVEAFNTGVSGLRAINHIATLEHIVNLHPDLVLVGVNDWNRHIILNYPNDMPEKFSGKTFPSWQVGIRLRNTLLGQLLVGLQMQSIVEDTERKWERRRSFIQTPNSLGRADVRQFKPSTVLVEYQEHLSSLFDLCKCEAIPCLIITQPRAYQEATTEERKRTFWMTPPYANYTLDFDSMVHIAKLYNNYLIAEADRIAYICRNHFDVPQSR